MDIPFLLHSDSVPFNFVLTWLEGVALAQKTGLLDPWTPSSGDGEEFSPSPFAGPFDGYASTASHFSPHPELAENWSPRERPSSHTHVPCHSHSFFHDPRRSMAPPEMWALPTYPQPYVASSRTMPPPYPDASGYMQPSPVHSPQVTPYGSPSLYHLPAFLQPGSDKLHHALRQQQAVSTRQQWAAANPALCSAQERSRRSQAAHVTERRRRSGIVTTPYYQLAMPYLAS